MAKKRKISNEQLEVEQELMLEEAEVEFDTDIDFEGLEFEEEEYDTQEMGEDEEVQEVEELEFEDGETSDVQNPEVVVEEELEKFNSSEFNIVSAKPYSNNKSKSGVATLINSENGGRRLTTSRDLTERIGNPEAVTIAFDKSKIAISAIQLNSENSFKLGRIGKKGVIYAADLVKKITEEYNLDYTRGVSITFHEVEYKVDGDKIVAIITIL